MNKFAQKSAIRSLITPLLVIGLLSTFLPVYAAETALPDWTIGPFARPANAQPVIRPNPDSVFTCPMRGGEIHWETRHTFNPAAVVKDEQIFLLYRAEGDDGKKQIGGYASRGGLAWSSDGIRFTTKPEPVLFPAEDSQQEHEWTGGCEDPRIAERKDGLFVVLYTQYTGLKSEGHYGAWRLGLASSTNLTEWTKHGSPFAGTRFENLRTKSAAIVHEVKDGHLVAAKINGTYWMYFGERAVNVATSDDLLTWKPLENDQGKLLEVMKTRPGYFDSNLTEVGPQIIRTDKGIVMIYNGKNDKKSGDPELPGGIYACGQALFSLDDPTKLITRLDKPFFQPELPWEKTGQYGAGTTFAEGLVYYNNTWFLYYGCADTFVGVAMARQAAAAQ
jgi:beta-1,2-mannosidase